MRTLAYVTYDEVSDYLTNVNRIVPIPLWTLRYIHSVGSMQAIELARPLVALADTPLSATRVRRDGMKPPGTRKKK